MNFKLGDVVQPTPEVAALIPNFTSVAYGVVVSTNGANATRPLLIAWVTQERTISSISMLAWRDSELRLSALSTGALDDAEDR